VAAPRLLLIDPTFKENGRESGHFLLRHLFFLIARLLFNRPTLAK
jgi:hypothetical protein